MNKQQIIFFDGYCTLCNGFVQFIIKNDRSKQFKFASLQGKNALKNLPEEKITAMDSVVLVSDDQQYTKSEAALKILVQLDGLWKTTFILYIFPLFLRNIVYDFIGKNRYKWFGKRDVCRMPEEGDEGRFLD